MNPTDGHNHPVACAAVWQSAEPVQGEMRCQVLVVAVDRKEQLDQHRNDNKNNPGAPSKFGDGKNHHHNGCTKSTKTVDYHLDAPPTVITENGSRFGNFLAFFEMTDLPPTPGHTDLGEGE